MLLLIVKVQTLIEYKTDFVIDKDGSSNILKMLERSHVVFNYVTQYCQNKNEVNPVEDLYFSDFEDFVAYVKASDFNYDTDTEEVLAKLREQAKDAGYEIDSELTAIERSILQTKQSELSKHKDPITDMIEKEIAGRYYYQKGKVQIGLRNDPEVQEAISVLNNPKRYKELLKGR